jgi:hypothetical protein
MHPMLLYLGEACLIPIERRVLEKKNGHILYSVHGIIGQELEIPTMKR